jgi:hypothetical protein
LQTREVWGSDERWREPPRCKGDGDEDEAAWESAWSGGEGVHADVAAREEFLELEETPGSLR